MPGLGRPVQVHQPAGGRLLQHPPGHCRLARRQVRHKVLVVGDGPARDWFENDRDCQAWEPGGDEFLSSALTEALCMARSLPAADFERHLVLTTDRSVAELATPAALWSWRKLTTTRPTMP